MRGGRPVAVLCLFALVQVLAGCAAEGSASPAADGFAREHAAAIEAAAGRMLAFEAALGRLEREPTVAVLDATAIAARRAKRLVTPATEWQVSESGEEEDLGQAELEIHEAAISFLAVIDSLRAARRVPSPATLAVYHGRIGRAREEWDEGTRQLWYLAHKANAPGV